MSPPHPYSLALRVNVARHLAIAGVVLAFALGWVLHCLDRSVPWWLDTPAVFGFYGLLYFVLDRWAWRRPQVASLLHVPDLGGTWTGSLRTSRDNFQNDHPVTVTITQSWSTMRIVLEAASSRSHSFAAHVFDGAGTEPYEIVYQYENTPKAGAPADMHAHRGTAHLRLSADRRTLEGDYYSGRDRQNHGQLVLRREGM